jgi:hypothetical protein
MIPIIEKEKSMLKALEIYNRYWGVLQRLFNQIGNLANHAFAKQHDENHRTNKVPKPATVVDPFNFSNLKPINKISKQQFPA